MSNVISLQDDDFHRSAGVQDIYRLGLIWRHLRRISSACCGIICRRLGSRADTRFVAILLAIFICFGFPETAYAAACNIQKDGALRISGSIDAKLADCVRSLANTPWDTVVVTSSGGLPLPAIEIADIIAEHRAEIIIRGGCNSSCANYWLPVARKIRLLPGAMLSLHGGPDLALVEAAKAITGLEAKTEHVEMVTAQQNFISKYNVNRGWLLERDLSQYLLKEPFDTFATKEGSFGKFVAGAAVRINPEAKMNGRFFIMVEEEFLRSCLPNVELASLANTLVQRLESNPQLKRKKMYVNGFQSGTMRCKLQEVR